MKSPISANRFGKSHTLLFFPIKAELSMLMSLFLQYSMKSAMLKKWRFGVSYHS